MCFDQGGINPIQVHDEASIWKQTFFFFSQLHVKE
jgi:hypothetical protein